MHQRRPRRSLTAAVTGGVLAAGCLAFLPANAGAAPLGDGPPSAHATQARTPARTAAAARPAGARQADFAAAAAEFRVPVSVLLAVSYQESQWDAHAGQYNTGGGYGPMNLTDVTPAMTDNGGAGTAGRHDLDAFTGAPAQHTLTTAAALAGTPAARLRTVPRDNIRGGAALLAHYQKAATGGTSTDPAQWYAAVARYSEASDSTVAGAFADRVFTTLRTGASRTADGGYPIHLDGLGAVRPPNAQAGRYHLHGGTGSAATPECPATVTCRFLPAAASNGQVADRPSDGMDIKYIVIHDTEGSYQAAIDTFRSAGGTSAHYVMKASDGSVTQMEADKDVAFHAGNYWFNMHSIGIEHEGYAAHGATWYSQAQYQATADLVKYLAQRYGIPLDRQHLIGHDNVPAPTDGGQAGMHWDPGPFWDWNHLMALLGTPAGTHGVGATGTAVTIAPDFATNKQTVHVCPADDPTGATTSCVDRTEPSNLLYVHASASASSAVLGDPYLHGTGAGTTDIADWSGTVSAGQQYVVAGQSGDWTAIWFAGKKGWILNPAGKNTVPAPGVQIVAGKGTAATAVYGVAYPDASEYPSGLSPSTMAPLSKYTLPPGQAYVAAQPPAGTDDYFASSGRLVKGAKKFFTLQFNHRVELVDAAAVTASHSK